MDIYDQINRVKKTLKLNNNDLGQILEKSGDTFRKALNRKSLSDAEIKLISETLSVLKQGSNSNEIQEINELDRLITVKIQKNKSSILDKILNEDQEAYLKNKLKDDSAYTEIIKKEPDAVWVDFSSFMNIPVVQKRAQAGFLSGWGDDEYLEELPTIPWEVDREYKGKYIAFEVTGDSMDDNSRDSIIEGDTLICREIQRHHWVNKLHLHRWKNFVVVHRTEGILVKRVLEHDTDTGRLILHSLNPLFDDQEVLMDDLIALFNVIDIHRSL